MLRNGGTDADSQCSKMDRSGSRDTGWRRYRRIYIKRYYIYRSKIRTDQRSKTVCYSSGENDSKDAEDKKCGNSERDTLPESSCISDFAFTGQMPELPTGCEITSLTMTLNYYGYSADKMAMALEYLPTVGWTNTYYGDNETLYGNDIYNYFIGNPQSETDGLSCGAGAIVTAADGYLADNGNAMKAEDETGSEPEQLDRFVSEGTPVVVWGTIGMEERQIMVSWNTEDGREASWAMNDHCVVLIGYSADSVTVADPIEGIVSYDRAQFESAFRSRGNQCVILKNVQ